jgi:N-formylglutamate amidohydrolase
MQIISYSENLLVKRHRGTMPIILTAPHGGSESPPNVQERSKKNGCDFKIKKDKETDIITEGVAQTILQLTGLSPYVVIAKFHRKFIDANRNLDCAFTDSDAKEFYEEYHNRIAKYVSQILEENDNRGFLFDLHGVNTENLAPDKPKADIYLGTNNGGTLQPSFKREDLFKTHGLHGLLKASEHQTSSGGANTVFKYTIYPKNKSETEEFLDGGFTVINSVKFGINCIQIELADTIRDNDEKRSFIIEDLAFAMINFVRRHAPF